MNTQVITSYNGQEINTRAKARTACKEILSKSKHITAKVLDKGTPLKGAARWFVVIETAAEATREVLKLSSVQPPKVNRKAVSFARKANKTWFKREHQKPVIVYHRNIRKVSANV